MRRLLFLAVLALTCMPPRAHALSLGNLELRSALHQPLNARIPILSATGDEIDTLNVRIASAEQFERAGVTYFALLTQLRFNIEQTRVGPDYIVITSHDPVKEPYLNFLVEVNWARGRLIREFTALLDPPLYDPNRRIAWTPPRVSAAPAPQAAVAEAPKPGPPVRGAAGESWRSTDQRVYRYDTARTRAVSRVTPSADGSYPTLWSAAKAMRSGPAVSMHQMMIALLRANPDAFIRGNINLLKKGYVLKMPDQGALNTLTREQALAEFNRHHALWQEYRQRGALAAPTRPTGAAVAATAPPADSGVAAAPKESASEDRLKLLSVRESSGAGAAGGASAADASEELALAQEKTAAGERENEELRSRLRESEQIIENLKTRIALQDDQLADLQRKLAEAGGAVAVAPGASSQITSAPVEDDDPESWRRLDQEVSMLAEPPTAPAEAQAPVEAPAEVTPESWRSLEQEVLTDIAAPPPRPEPDPDIDETLAAAEPPATVPDPSGTGVAPPEDTSGTSSTADTPSAAPSDGAPTTMTGDVGQGAAPEAEAVAETAPSPAEAAPPAEEKGLIATLAERVRGIAPQALVESIPGGIFTLLGGVLAAVALVVLLFARRRAEPAPASVPVVADADFVIEVPPAARDRIMTVDAALEEPPAGGLDTFGAQETIQMTSPPGAAKPAAAEPEEDPLAEVNVYLAYERFDEAERLIKEAIAKYPNEHQYKLRLLEVYYSSNNKPAYETAARALQAAVGGAGPLWDTALAMWREISPTRDLFAAAAEPEAAGEAPLRQFVDITAVDERMTRTVTSTREGAEPIAFDLEPAEMRAEESAGLDFDLGTQEKSALDLLDITAPANGGAEPEEIFDIAAESGGVVENLLDMSVPSAIEGASPAVNELLSLTKSGTAQGDSLSTLADAEELLAETDFDVTGGEPDILKAERAAETLVEFDLGGAEGASPFGPANVVDFPVRDETPVEPVAPPDSLTTVVDIAPSAAEATAMEFDIESLDLAPEIEQPPLPEVGDVDAISLDADTIRLFEGDATTSGGDVTSPGLTGSETVGAATANELDLTADLFGLGPEGGAPRREATLDELPSDGDTLDDITKSLEETVGMKDEAEMPTVDLTLDTGVISEMDVAAGLFSDDLQPASGAETVGLTDVQFPDGQSTSDEVDTKLNLAKAYIELGDAAGARSILDEVVSAGSEGQREEAQRLLRELTT